MRLKSNRSHLRSLLDKDGWGSNWGFDSLELGFGSSVNDEVIHNHVLPDFSLWEVNLSLGLSGLEHRSNHNITSEHELVINFSGDLVFRELHHQRSGDWNSSGMSLLH